MILKSIKSSNVSLFIIVKEENVIVFFVKKTKNLHKKLQKYINNASEMHRLKQHPEI